MSYEPSTPMLPLRHDSGVGKDGLPVGGDEKAEEDVVEHEHGDPRVPLVHGEEA